MSGESLYLLALGDSDTALCFSASEVLDLHELVSTAISVIGVGPDRSWS